MHRTAFAGERLDIRAADWNRVLGYVNRQTTGATPGSSSSQTVVYAKNTFGSAIPAGGVARIGLKSSKTIDKTKSLGDQFFELTAPTNTLASWDNLVVAIDPIPDGKMGRVCVEGLCWALIEAASEPATASDKPWLVPASVSSVWMFRRMWSGCARLVLPLASGDTSGSTSDLCPVILGSSQPEVTATLTGSWSSNLATCTVTDIRGGSFAASTTSNVFDPRGVFSSLSSGDAVSAIWIGGNRVLAINPAASSGSSSDFRLGYTGSGGVSARSGTTAGSGTVSLVTQSGSTLTTTGTTVTAYNTFSSAVAGSAYVHLSKDSNSGLWHVSGEDCG